MDRRIAWLLPEWNRRRYLRQFGTAVAVILVILLIALGGIYAAERQAKEKSVKSAMERNTEQGTEQVSNWRRQHVSSTKIVSQSNKLRAYGDTPIVTTLNSILNSMPDEAVGVHFINRRNRTVLESATKGTDPDAQRFAWLETARLETPSIEEVRMTEAYTVGNDTRVVFFSPTHSFHHAVALEVSLDKSFDFHEPVSGAETQIVYRNATLMYGSGSESSGSPYEGPEREALYNMTKYLPSLTDNNTFDGSENLTMVQANGELVNYGKVPDAKMAVVTSASTDAYGVGQETLAYLGMIFVFVALSLGAVGFLVERPVSRSISQLAERTEALERGDLDVDLETNRSDEVGTLYARFASMRDSLAERIDAIESAREEARAEADAARREAEAARQEAEAFNAHLEATADEYGETIRACADGDLTRRLEPDEESEAMTEIARAFNEMLDDLEATLARVRSFADDVADSTTDATTATRRARDTGREVNEEAGEIAADAVEQDEYLADVTEEMNDLSATVQEVAATADQVAELAAETETVADEGAAAAEEAMTEMETIEAATAETADEIRNLDAEVERVAEIVDLIDDIADQTNTLALNASIEAARAGESGQGFAVVADEVKTLAEETREATEEIDDLLSALSERTGDAVEDMESMREDVVGGVETTQGALDALDGIADQVRDTNQGVQEISDATDDQADTAQAVVSLVDRVAEISDRTSDRAEGLADTADEQATSLDEVTRTAESIESQAAELSELLDELTLDADSADTPDDSDAERPVSADSGLEGDLDLFTADSGGVAASVIDSTDTDLSADGNFSAEDWPEPDSPEAESLTADGPVDDPTPVGDGTSADPDRESDLDGDDRVAAAESPESDSATSSGDGDGSNEADSQERV